VAGGFGIRLSWSVKASAVITGISLVGVSATILSMVSALAALSRFL
jgi:hypothetical protein